MKRNLLLILAFALCLGCMAQTTIQMEEYNGVYRIPCTVNGAKMKFIFDTGASQVCLSMTMAEYLLDNDFITADDIIGNGSTTVADGRIVNHVKINIRDLEIQGNHLYNVPAVVIEGQNAPLLMGQSAIQKLGSIVINGNTMIIQNGYASGDNEYYRKLLEEALDAYDNGLFERAAEKFEQLYNGGFFSDYILYLYAQCLEEIRNYERAEAVLNTISDFHSLGEEEPKLYYLIGTVKMNLEKDEEAIRYFELTVKKTNNKNILMFGSYERIGLIYFGKEEYFKAIKNYEAAIETFAALNGVSTAYIWRDAKNLLNKGQKSYRTPTSDMVIYMLCELYYRTLKWSDEYYNTQIDTLVRAGNQMAIMRRMPVLE